MVLLSNTIRSNFEQNLEKLELNIGEAIRLDKVEYNWEWVGLGLEVLFSYNNISRIARLNIYLKICILLNLVVFQYTIYISSVSILFMLTIMYMSEY